VEAAGVASTLGTVGASALWTYSVGRCAFGVNEKFH
jgi:hypothetical protein